MRKANIDYPADGKFLELREKYVEIFKKPISFNNDDDDRSSDGHGNDSDGNDDNDDEDGNNGNGDKEVNDKEPSDFIKVSLEDFENEPSGTDTRPEKQAYQNEKDSVDPTENKAIVEDVTEEEEVIMSTPETYTQRLEKNVDLVGEGVALDEEMREWKSRMLVRILLKKLLLVLLFENVFETHYGEKVFSIRLNMETLAPDLWIDANVVDYWAAILNHEESFKEVHSPLRHFSRLVVLQALCLMEP